MQAPRTSCEISFMHALYFTVRSKTCQYLPYHLPRTLHVCTSPLPSPPCVQMKGRQERYYDSKEKDGTTLQMLHDINTSVGLKDYRSHNVQKITHDLGLHTLQDTED